MKPLDNIKIEWSENFAYAIGLITADGCLSKDSRHIDMTSKDKEQIVSFKKCLNVNNKIGKKTRGSLSNKKYYRVQIGSIKFYNFLISIGLTPSKSKSIGVLDIPLRYWRDFLRGYIDGDGCISVHSHPESKHPQLRVRMFSGSKKFLLWIKTIINRKLAPRGGWVSKACRAYILTYGKEDSIKILRYIYYNDSVLCLKRKREIASPFI